MIGYEPAPGAQIALNVRSGLTEAWLAAADAAVVDGATYWPSLFLIDAKTSPEALASA